MDNKFLDVMVPIKTDSGKTIWTKVGTYMPNNGNGKHKAIVSLMSLPIGAQAPLNLFLFDGNKQQTTRSNSAGSRSTHNSRSKDSFGDGDEESFADAMSNAGDPYWGHGDHDDVPF